MHVIFNLQFFFFPFCYDFLSFLFYWHPKALPHNERKGTLNGDQGIYSTHNSSDYFALTEFETVPLHA